jgi:hypothetical protein
MDPSAKTKIVPVDAVELFAFGAGAATVGSTVVLVLLGIPNLSSSSFVVVVIVLVVSPVLVEDVTDVAVDVAIRAHSPLMKTAGSADPNGEACIHVGLLECATEIVWF